MGSCCVKAKKNPPKNKGNAAAQQGFGPSPFDQEEIQMQAALEANYAQQKGRNGQASNQAKSIGGPKNEPEPIAPVFNRNMSEQERQQQRDDRLAATEARVKAQERAGLSKQGYVDMKFKEKQKKDLEMARRENAFNQKGDDLAWKMNGQFKT